MTGTSGRRLLNQDDGHLVLYRDPADPASVWSTGTWNAGPSTLWLQDDGNLVLRRNSDAMPIWAGNTVVSPP